MAWFILICLLVIGIVLVLVEVIFIPGTTLVGILGVIVTAVGIYYGFMAFEYELALAILVLTGIVNLLVIIYGFRSGVWNKFSLKGTMTSRNFDDRLLGLEIGQKGKTVSDFRPYGEVEFGDKIYEAKSERGYLSQGTEVYIERLESNKIIINKQ
jgi:membrane-bound ClpP family serine protease